MARRGPGDKPRRVLVLTRDPLGRLLHSVICAPITFTVRHLATEVPVGQEAGLAAESVADFDNTLPLARTPPPSAPGPSERSHHGCRVPRPHHRRRVRRLALRSRKPRRAGRDLSYVFSATQSRSTVNRRAPWAIAATPPTRRSSTPWRVSVERICSTSSGGASVVIQLDDAAGNAIRLYIGEPRQDGLLAVESPPVEGDRHVVSGRRSTGAYACEELVRRQGKRVGSHRYQTTEPPIEKGRSLRPASAGPVGTRWEPSRRKAKAQSPRPRPPSGAVVSRPVGGILSVARRRRGGHPSVRPT